MFLDLPYGYLSRHFKELKEIRQQKSVFSMKPSGLLSVKYTLSALLPAWSINYWKKDVEVTSLIDMSNSCRSVFASHIFIGYSVHMCLGLLHHLGELTSLFLHNPPPQPWQCPLFWSLLLSEINNYSGFLLTSVTMVYLSYGISLLLTYLNL